MPRFISVGSVLFSCMVCLPASAVGQEIGLGAGYGATSRDDLVDGPGVHAWAAYDVLPFLRLEASAERVWGRRTDRRPHCVTVVEGTPPWECGVEDVRDFTTITGGEVAAILLTPAILRTRLGAGATIGAKRFDVGSEGLDSGRVITPAEGRSRTLGTRGWLAFVDHRIPGSAASLRLSYRAYDADFGGCVTDTWSLCDEQSFDHVGLGVVFRP